MRRLVILACIVMLAAGVPALAQNGPTTRRSVQTPLRVSQLKALTVMYVEVDTTLMDIAQVVPPALENIANSLAEHGLSPAGAPVVEYENATMDPGRLFKLRIGFPVADDAKPIGSLQVARISPGRCATTVYMGPTRDLPTAYQRLFVQMAVQGLTPSGVRRERYLYMEDRASPNDVVLIEIELKN
jgi:effector-binding domain-containing protein